MKVFVAVILAASLTANIYTGIGIIKTEKEMQSWRQVAISDDTKILQQTETIRSSHETLVACLNKFGLQ